MLGFCATLAPTVATPPAAASAASPPLAQSPQAAESVVWTALVNCATTPSGIQKSAGRDDSYDAGATSAQQIASGDAVFEFTAGAANKGLFCGLSHSPIGTDFSDIDFAIKLTTFGVAEIRENNSYVGETSYTAGDVFRIAIQNGQIDYYKNGGFLMTSRKTPLFPLRADAAFASIGARVDNAAIGAISLAAPADWKMYQHDETHSGFSPASQLGTGNASSLTQAWAFTTGGWVTGTPVVASGVVYIGSWDGHLYALRESDGSLLWNYDAGTIQVGACGLTFGIDSTAAVAGGRVYFANGLAELHAVDAATGAAVWKTQLADPALAFHVWASPTVFDGKIYVGLSSHCVNPCIQGKLVCVDANDGRVLWTFNAAPENSTGGAVWSSVAVDAGRKTVYVGTGNYCTGSDTHSTAVVALNSDNGALRWEFKKLTADPRNYDFGASPVLFDIDGRPALAIPSKDGHCYALNRINGELIWDAVVTDGDSAGGIISTPAVAYGRLFFGATIQARSGKAVALDQRDGRIVWESPLSKPVRGAVAVAGGALFLACEDGALRAYDVSSGEQLWIAQRGQMSGGVSLSRRAVFVGSLDKKVYSFALPNPTQPAVRSITALEPGEGDVWRIKTRNEVAWSVSSGVAKVDVALSRDGGATWNPIAAGIDASAGSLRFKIKKPRSESALIRVSDSSDSTVFGLSGIFRIR
jgi:outer membrane protein assembly factor BamB